MNKKVVTLLPLLFVTSLISQEEAINGTLSINPNIGISDTNRTELNSMLNNLLADEYLLYTKTLNVHWNIVGPFFGSLHGGLFQEQYEALLGFVDMVAERVRMLGGVALGSMTEFLQHTQLKEMSGKLISETNSISALLADHESIIRRLRTDINRSMELGDAGTNNFLSDLITKHEKMAWKLRAHLQKA